MSDLQEIPARPQDWSEDFGSENGCYQHTCSTCGRDYLGHKRRYATCKECASKLERGNEVIKQLRELRKFGMVTVYTPDIDALLLRISVLEKAEQSAVEQTLADFGRARNSEDGLPAKTRMFVEHVKAAGRCGGVTDGGRFVCIREPGHVGGCDRQADKSDGRPKISTDAALRLRALVEQEPGVNTTFNLVQVEAWLDAAGIDVSDE